MTGDVHASGPPMVKSANPSGAMLALAAAGMLVYRHSRPAAMALAGERAAAPVACPLCRWEPLFFCRLLRVCGMRVDRVQCWAGV